MKYWYDGYLGWRKPVSKEVLQAKNSYRAQSERCNNKNSAKYRLYGGKGVRVEYSHREFVGWWLENVITREWKSPTVGRLDHSKGYSFDNIEMQERSENSLERLRRNPTRAGQQKIPVIAIRDGERWEFPSVKSAAAHFGILDSSISNNCRGRSKTCDGGLKFSYLEASA